MENNILKDGNKEMRGEEEILERKRASKMCNNGEGEEESNVGEREE